MKKNFFRMIVSICLYSFLGFALLSLVGCGGGGSDASPATTNEPPSTLPAAHIPQISNLQYSPQSATQNQGNGVIIVAGTINFTDQGGDIVKVTINIYDPNNKLLSTDQIPLQNITGMVSGNINISAKIDTSTAGNYRFEMNVTDLAGYSSNTLSGTFSIIPPDPILEKTLLLRGKWHFVYSIISTFTDDYSLSTINGTKNNQGGYYIYGKDQWGDLVVSTYWPSDGNWSLLDTSIIIDKFYDYYTDGATILSNSCYYQIDKSTGNWSRCYPLSGIKTSQNPEMAIDEDGSSKVLAEEELLLENISVEPFNEDAREKYLQLKNAIDQK